MFKQLLGIILASAFCAAIPASAQQSLDHFEVGAFADYFRFSQTDPARNFIGLGGRVAVDMNRNLSLEAEMAYDFKRNYTQSFDNGVNTQLVTTRFRTLHGLFGPKLQTGSGPFRFFLTGKAGFDNFTLTTSNPPAGFTNAVGLNDGTTDFAVYPGGGIEAFAGPIGLRLEAGDEIYFDHGAHSNLRVTIGPQFRF